MSTEEKIYKFLSKELTKDLRDFTILQEQTNSYLLFNTYKVYKRNVTWCIQHTRTDDIVIFNHLRSAMTYCIFENSQKYQDSIYVKNLDRIISDNEFSLDLYKNLAKKTDDVDQKTLYYTKLAEHTIKKKKAVEELDKLINISRTLMNKKFRCL